MRHRVIACLLIAATASGSLHAQGAAASAARSARLVALARLDAAVRYFHPVVATTPSPWDSLFAAHVVATADAANARAYRQHVAAMLDGLGDALTTVPAPMQPAGWRVEMRGGIAHVRADAGVRNASARLSATTPILLDLRNASFALDRAILLSLVGNETAPAQYSLLYNGLPAATMRSSGGYGITWRNVESTSNSAPGAVVTNRVVIIVDSASILPAVLLDGVTSGRVRIVGVGTPTVAVDGDTHIIDLGEGVRARVRTTKTERFGIALPVDTIATAASATTVAMALLQAVSPVPRDSSALTGRHAGLPAVRPLLISNRDASAPYPAVGYRLLAAVRVWNTYDLFSPYKQQFTHPWHAVLTEKLPAVEHAANELALSLALAAIVKETNDGHSQLVSPVLSREFFRFGMSPIQGQFVEGKFVVSRVVAAIRDTTSVRPGDEILAVDGQSIDSLIARFSPYLASSTPQGLRYALQSRLLGGPSGAPMTLQLRVADGTTRTVRLMRPAAYDAAQVAGRGGPVMRMLPDSIAYVDMERLPAALVDSVFAMLSGARSVIFDMRGYPQGTGFQIGPRLTSSTSPVAVAHFDRPVRSSPDSTSQTVYPFDQTFPASTRSRFNGRTVMLIDERAISQSEHTGLIFRAMTGTTFIGTSTVGANGDITDIALPGGLRFIMTGQSVKFADGKQLQGVGLTPDIVAAPTIRGLRAGEDEVLTVAFQHLGGKGTLTYLEDRYVAPPPMRALPYEPMPDGWESNAPPSYRVGVDTSIAGPTNAADKGSLHVTWRGGVTGFAAASQAIAADEYRGKRITLSGHVKVKDVPTVGQHGAGMFLRIDRRDGEIVVDNMLQRLVKGTTDWTRIAITLDVPSDAAGLLLGMVFTGEGEGWLDDIAISIVDASTPVTAQPTGMKHDERSLASVLGVYATASRALVNPRFLLRVSR